MTVKYFIHIRGGLLKCLGYRVPLLNQKNKENSTANTSLNLQHIPQTLSDRQSNTFKGVML